MALQLEPASIARQLAHHAFVLVPKNMACWYVLKSMSNNTLKPNLICGKDEHLSIYTHGRRNDHE